MASSTNSSSRESNVVFRASVGDACSSSRSDKVKLRERMSKEAGMSCFKDKSNHWIKWRLYKYLKGRARGGGAYKVSKINRRKKNQTTNLHPVANRHSESPTSKKNTINQQNKKKITI